MHRVERRTLLILGGIVALALLIHLPALRYSRPFCCDNLTILEWADGATWADAWGGNRLFVSEWRPLPHLLILGSYRAFGLGSLAPYLLINVGLWSMCVFLVYRLAARLTGSVQAALVGAAFLVCGRQTAAISEFLMGTQTGFACLFGLTAVTLAVKDREPSWRRAAAIAALLMASSFGKEYGFAFAMGLTVWGLVDGRPRVAIAGSVVAASYLVLRAGLGSGLPGCELHGYFFTYRSVCLHTLNMTTVTQVAYNVCAGLLQTLFPGWLSTDGLIGLSPRRLAQSAFWLVFIVTGLRKAPLVTVAVLVIAANTLLQAPLVRSRNTIVSLTMVSVLVASGYAWVRAWASATIGPAGVRVLPVLAVISLTARGYVATNNISRETRTHAIQNPCIALQQNFPVNAAFVTKVKRAYGLPDPECTQPAAERFLSE